MSIYVPIRDELLEAYRARGLSMSPYKNDITTPVYVASEVLEDLRDMFAEYRDANIAQVQEFIKAQSRDFLPPADRFYIELPHMDAGPFNQDAEILVEKVKPDSGYEWEYELTLRTREANTITLLDGFVQINNGRIAARKTTQPGAVINKKSGKVTLLDTPELHVWNVMGGVCQVVVAFCRLLLAKNAAVSDRVYSADEQKQWRRHTSPKKMPRYRVLTINRPSFLNDSTKHDNEDGEHEPEKRRHHVRGHFRTYRHDRYRPEQRGTYWIRPHWRGSEELGVVDTPVRVRKHMGRSLITRVQSIVKAMVSSD